MLSGEHCVLDLPKKALFKAQFLQQQEQQALFAHVFWGFSPKKSDNLVNTKIQQK